MDDNEELIKIIERRIKAIDRSLRWYERINEANDLITEDGKIEDLEEKKQRHERILSLLKEGKEPTDCSNCIYFREPYDKENYFEFENECKKLNLAQFSTIEHMFCENFAPKETEK